MNPLRYADDHRSFSRRRWLQGARTFVWVALVTLLVWVYADMEHTGQEEFKAVIHLTTGKLSNLALLSDPGVRLSFELRGNRKMLDRFKRQLSAKGGVLEYDVSNDYGPGRHAVDVAEILERAALLEQQGLTLLSMSQPTVDVSLDKLVTRKVKVSFTHTGAKLVAQAVVSPPEVAVRAAAATWKRILAVQSSPVLNTVSTDLAGVPTQDGKGTVQVALASVIEGQAVEPLVRAVTVTFTIDERKTTGEVRLSVQVLTSRRWVEEDIWARYALKRKDETEWYPRITVRGPQKHLEQLSTLKIDAYIKLDAGDEKPPNYWGSKVVIRFPPGLDVQLVGPAPEVQLKLVERTTTSGVP